MKPKTFEDIVGNHCCCGNERHGNIKFFSITDEGDCLCFQPNKPISDLETIPQKTTKTINFLKNQHRVFPERTCPYVLEHNLKRIENEDDKIDAYTVVNYVFLSMTKVTDLETFEPIAPIKFHINDERLVYTQNKKSFGLCPCGYKHIVDGEEYDYVFIVNDRVVGIDLKKQLILNIFSICEKCNIPPEYFMYVYVGLYKAMRELNTHNENTLFNHGLPGYQHLIINYMNVLEKYITSDVHRNYLYFNETYKNMNEKEVEKQMKREKEAQMKMIQQQYSNLVPTGSSKPITMLDEESQNKMANALYSGNIKQLEKVSNDAAGGGKKISRIIKEERNGQTIIRIQMADKTPEEIEKEEKERMKEEQKEIMEKRRKRMEKGENILKHLYKEMACNYQNDLEKSLDDCYQDEINPNELEKKVKQIQERKKQEKQLNEQMEKKKDIEENQKNGIKEPQPKQSSTDKMKSFQQRQQELYKQRQKELEKRKELEQSQNQKGKKDDDSSSDEDDNEVPSVVRMPSSQSHQNKYNTTNRTNENKSQNKVWEVDRVEYVGNKEITYINVDKSKVDEILKLQNSNNQLIGYKDQDAQNAIRYEYITRQVGGDADEIIFVDKSQLEQYNKMRHAQHSNIKGYENYLPGGFANEGGRNGVYTEKMFEEQRKRMMQEQMKQQQQEMFMKSKGHKLNENKEEKNDNENNEIQSIEPKELICENGTLKFKVRHSKGTVLVVVNPSTTIGEIIAHVKWHLQKKGVSKLDGILKIGKNEYNDLDKTIEQLGLKPSMFTYS